MMDPRGWRESRVKVYSAEGQEQDGGSLVSL